MRKGVFIYNRIKAVLAEKGVSNKTLAEEMGVSEDTVSSWCVQRRQPSWENLYAIADYLKIDVRELLVPNKESPRKDFKF
jgi:putative transcriptional regulator